MKKRLLLIIVILSIILVGCTKVSKEANQKEEVVAEQAETKDIIKTEFLPFCSNWNDCDDYCHSYSGECEDYCAEHPEVEYCKIAFGFLLEGNRFATATQRKECSEPIIFNSPPVNLDKIDWIVPLGAMVDDHVTPVDHQYYQAYHNDLIEVTSPGDGKIITIERMINGRDDDWRLIIQHTCSIESIYIHIDKLSNKLMKGASSKRTSNPSLEVNEGEILGWYDQNVDYNVVDYDIEIGLINKESFSVAETWKIHVQDPFLYFNDKIKSRMIELSQRSEEPFGGKIDYDIDGKLIGMWFLEGTNGYAGLDFPSSSYHQGHLAIAPDNIDPSYTIVSVGTYNGGEEGYQFGVGNIDASKIGLGEKVEWTLHNLGYEKDGVIQPNWGVPKGTKVVSMEGIGKVTFELLEDRKLKADFGDGVRYYVR